MVTVPTPESKAYKLYIPIICKVVIGKDVVFHEGSLWKWHSCHQGDLVVIVEETIEDHAVITNIPSNNIDNIGEASEGVLSFRSRATKKRSRSRIAHTNGSPLRKVKLLSDVYNTCTFALHVADLL